MAAIPPRILKVSCAGWLHLSPTIFTCLFLPSIGNPETCSGSGCGNLRGTKREEPQTLLRQDCRAKRDSLRGWHLRLRVVLARRVPNGASQGPLQNQDLPPQHRQARQNLPRHPQEQVVPCSADQISSPLHSGLDVSPQLGRPLGPGDRRCLEGRPRFRHQEGQRVDLAVCQQLSDSA